MEGVLRMSKSVYFALGKGQISRAKNKGVLLRCGICRKPLQQGDIVKGSPKFHLKYRHKKCYEESLID